MTRRWVDYLFLVIGLAILWPLALYLEFTE